MAIKQAVSTQARMPSRPATRSWRRTRRRCRRRDRRRAISCCARQGRQDFYPASVMPLIKKSHRGRRHVAGCRPRSAFAQAIRAADHVRRGAGLRRQPDPQLGHRPKLLGAEEKGLYDQEDRRGHRRRRRACRWGRTSSSTCSAWRTPSTTWPSTCTNPRQSLSPQGDGQPRPQQATRRQTERFYDSEGRSPEPSPDRRELLTLQDVRRAVCGGGRRDPSRHRLRDDGRRRRWAAAAVEGLDTILERLENAESKHGERSAPPTVLRRLGQPGPPRHESGQALRLPAGGRGAARRRSSSSRRAATSAISLAGQRPE